MPFSNFYSMNNLDPGGGEAGGGNFPNGTGATSGAGAAGSGVGGGTYPTSTQSTYPTSTPSLTNAPQQQQMANQNTTPPVPGLGLPDVKTGTEKANAALSNTLGQNVAQSQTVTPPGATGVFANDQWVNEAGNRFDYGDATQAPGRARAGTALAKGAVKTWVNYDGSRDTQLHEGGETSWRRVNRWTQEGVAEHGLTPQEAHNAALARLKRDFELTNLDWRNSGFDLSNVQSAAPGQDWAKANAVGATPPPVVTPGVVPKIADSNVPGFVPSTKAPTPQQPGIDPKTGLPQATAPQTGDPNQPFLDEASIDMVRSNAEQALSAIRGLRGGRDKTGPLGAYREQTLSRALQAYLSMNAGGNMSDPMSYANGGAGELINRLNSGQGIGNFLRENAGNMMDGLDYSNLDSGQIMDYLNLAGGAATFGYSPMGKYGMENTLADLQDQANIQSQRGINPTQSVLATSQGRGQFDDLLARFLALQQGR